MSAPIIEIRDVWKEYRLGLIGHGSIRRDFQSWFARLRGREDPNSPIFDDADRDPVRGDRFLALREISLDVHPGEMLGIIGRNGAGKSTLLKILTRITSPTRGEVRLRGRVVSLLEVGTGFHPDLTGRENVFLNGTILGMSKAEIRRKFDEIVEFAGIPKFIDTPVKRYSSGMYVRLAFAVAAHLEPEILIVDEVLAVGDYDFQKKCMDKMSEVTTRSGRTVLLVSHNLGAIRRLCTRTALLSHGQLLEVGDTPKVLNRYLTHVQKKEFEFAQPTNGDKPMHLRRVRVLGRDGLPSMEAEYRDGFSFEIEYEVNEETKSAMVWAAVRTSDETEVFFSADYDTSPELLGPRKPGYYRTVLKVPGKLLNHGTYYLVIGISNLAPEVAYDRVEMPGLTVNDTKNDLSNEAAKRIGLVTPRLGWDIRYISPPAGDLR